MLNKYFSELIAIPLLNAESWSQKEWPRYNAPHMSLTPGAKLGDYELLSLLGAGGMGEVYRARDPVLKREVAIKVLPSFVSPKS